MGARASAPAPNPAAAKKAAAEAPREAGLLRAATAPERAEAESPEPSPSPSRSAEVSRPKLHPAPPRFSPLCAALDPRSLAAAAADFGDADGDRPTFLRDAVDDGGLRSGLGSGASSLSAAAASAAPASGGSASAPPTSADSIAGWQELAAEVMAEGQGEGAMGGGEAATPPPADPLLPLPPATLRPGGAFLLAYQLQDTLGAGAFGTVVAARRRADGARVVAKVWRSVAAADAAAAASEAAVLAALSSTCPYVVRHEAAYVEEGRVVMVMEAAPSGDLGAHLRSRPQRRLPERHALTVLAQVLAALRASHARGVVHRDVKAGNVLLFPGGAPTLSPDPDPPPRVKLADFGLACRAGAGAAVAGTPACLAPEALRGRGAGPPADVWGAGVLLHHMLSGQLPFGGGGSVGAVAAAALAGRRGPLPASVSAPTRALLDAMLAPEPGDRPTAAALLARGELAGALERVGGGGAAAVPPPSPPAIAPAATARSLPAAGGGGDDGAALAALAALRARLAGERG